MALIKCMDCGRDMSDAAPTCPNCGRPNPAKVRDQKGTGKRPSLLGSLAGLAIVVFVLYTLGRENSSGSSDHRSSTQTAAGPSFSTTAAEMVSAYDANTVSADSKYKGSRFSVTGKID